MLEAFCKSKVVVTLKVSDMVLMVTMPIVQSTLESRLNAS